VQIGAYASLNRVAAITHRKYWRGVSDMNHLKKLEDEMSTWPRVSVHPHRFGGREFLFGRAEIGHVHIGGTVDVPFPRAVRDALLAEGLAEEHRWVPNSGWITFRARSEADLEHALWLMRLSYLRYVLKSDSDPVALFEHESEALHLSPQFKSLLEQFVPAKVRA
jgi:Luciferase